MALMSFSILKQCATFYRGTNLLFYFIFYFNWALSLKVLIFIKRKLDQSSLIPKHFKIIKILVTKILVCRNVRNIQTESMNHSKVIDKFLLRLKSQNKKILIFIKPSLTKSSIVSKHLKMINIFVAKILISLMKFDGKFQAFKLKA